MEEHLHGLRDSHNTCLINKMRREVNLAAVKRRSERRAGTPGAIMVDNKRDTSCCSIQSTGLQMPALQLILARDKEQMNLQNQT